MNGLTCFLAGVALAASLAGCGDSAMTPDSTPPPAHGYQLKTPELPLDAGVEKYLCYTVKLGEKTDVAITQFQAQTGQAVHHYEVFQALAPEQDGVWDCTQQQIKMTWLPLFGGGVGAAGLQLPAGAGFKIPGDAQLLLQLHLVNAMPTPTTTQVIINMDYADNPATVTPAGVFAFGTMNIDLAPGATGVNLGSQCALPKQMNVFAIQPHMHKLGKKITFQLGQDAASLQVAYKRDPWIFGAQPIDPFPMALSQGEYAGVTCTFDNTTTKDVAYGETTSDEMCYLVLFYTPFDRLGGCIN